MKSSKESEFEEQTFQERYARIMGLKNAGLEPSKVKIVSRWHLLFSVAVFGILGVWFLLHSTKTAEDSPPDITTVELSGTAPDTASIPPSQPEARESSQSDTPSVEVGSREPNADSPQDPPVNADEGKADANLELPVSQPTAAGSGQTGISKNISASLVVLLSTSLKDEAVARAKSLTASGKPASVILSTSGYYGVVLEYETFEQATAAVRTLSVPGDSKNKPYVMSANRVRARIFPESP